MNDDVIADLKQFIEATISQQMAGMATKDDLKDLATKEDVRKIVGGSINVAKDEILEAIGDTMTTRDAAVDNQLADHEHRLARLEHRAA